MTMPNFLIVGAMKCGTTTLHEVLGQHPEVFVTAHKELHYFDRHYQRGPTWYESQFSPALNQRAIGESTPSYMWDPQARQRLVTDLPEIRVLVMLRDPVKRAYSHYWHSRERGREELLTFEEALAAEPQRKVGPPAGWRQGSYLDRGRYLEQLLPLEAAYGRDHMKVVLLEDLTSSTAGTLGEVLTFLDVDPQPAEAMSLVRANPSGGWAPKGVPGSRRGRKAKARESALAELPKSGTPPMSEEIKQELSEHFRSHNAALAAWLGRDLSHWT